MLLRELAAVPLVDERPWPVRAAFPGDIRIGPGSQCEVLASPMSCVAIAVRVTPAKRLAPPQRPSFHQPLGKPGAGVIRNSRLVLTVHAFPPVQWLVARRLLAHEDGSYEWVAPGDYRVAEVRLLHDAGTVGEVGKVRAADNLLIRGDALNALTSLARLPEFAQEYAGKVKVGKLNTDDNPGTAMRYEIRGIPTLPLFKGGKVVDQRVGAMPKPEVLKMLEPHLAKVSS